MRVVSGQRVSAAETLARVAEWAEGPLRLVRSAAWGLGSSGFAVTLALAWRGLAALLGIGLAATLVSALAPKPSEAELAVVTVAPQPGARAARETPRDVLQQPLVAAQAGDAWITIPRPLPMFALEAPELDRQAPQHEARRRRDDSRREETLSFGGFREERPHLVLRVATGERPEADAARPFVIALVREAAGRGLSVQRAENPVMTPTRFGPVETADTTLSDGETSRGCIAFRRESDALPLALAGWWCPPAGRAADRRQLSCLIERLDLVAAGDDRALRQAFARTELARQPGCSVPRLSASGRKASWLDPDSQAPALKTAQRR